MTQNKRMIEAIHKAALAELERVRVEPEPPRHRSWDWQTWRDRQDNARHNMVETSAAVWLGVDRMEDATTMAVSRAYRGGEKLGLWYRVIENGRTVGLQLLEGGDNEA